MYTSLLSISFLLSQSPAPSLGEVPQAEPAPVATRLVDLDGDGSRDLLTFHADGTLAVGMNAGSRRFHAVPQELPRVLVTELLCTDLDGDGRPDLYLVSPAADVALLGEGGGRFREATEELGLVESGLGRSAERLDLDGDGLEDLVVHNQGSDVLFWARGDGRFEREERTSDGAAGPLAVPSALPVDPRSPLEPGSAEQGPSASGPRSMAGSSGPATTKSGLVATPVTPSSTAPLMGISFDARYVNDNMNEVGSADIADGSLTGADVSTSSGNVTFGGGATVTAEKGVFGSGSTASGVLSTVSGGQVNTASGDYSTVSGGYGNTASGYYTTVSGGSDNTASNKYSAVLGGRFNTASGDFSFAGGRRAKANHTGSFVWGDSVNVDKTSSATDQFNVYAESGARVFAVGQTTPSLVVAADGAVGIGTQTPATTLAVSGTGSFTGNVGFGTTAPARRVHVRDGSSGTTPASLSSLVVESSTEASISVISPANQEASLFLGNPTSGSNAGAIVFNPFGGVIPNGLVLRTADTNRLAITASGNVGIGTTAPAFKLEVNGTAHRVDNSSTWTVTSDARLKKDVHDLEGALETLLALRGVSFEYKDPALPGLRRGFLAQEVEKVLPEWVEDGHDGYKRLTVNGFEALAVEALREQQREIEALRTRVTALEGLESKLSVLESALAALATR